MSMQVKNQYQIAGHNITHEYLDTWTDEQIDGYTMALAKTS